MRAFGPSACSEGLRAVGLHTLRDGRGGLFNVPVGEHEVVARRLDGEVVARAEVVVRAGWVSQVWLYPTPAAAR